LLFAESLTVWLNRSAGPGTERAQGICSAANPTVFGQNWEVKKIKSRQNLGQNDFFFEIYMEKSVL
jgi:hypothetical protein